MGKRVAILILAILVSGLVIIGYFMSQGRKTLLTDPYKAITPDACLVIETSDIQSLFNSLSAEKGLFGELGKTEEFGNFYGRLRIISDQLNKPPFEKILNSGKALISFHQEGDKKIAPLLAMAVPAETGPRQIKELLRVSGFTKEITEQKKSGWQVLSVQYAETDSKDTLFISVRSGLIISSNSSTCFDKALIQTESGSDIRDQPGFSRVLLTAGRNQDKLFVVFRNLAPVIRPLLRPEASALADKIAKLAGTAGGDIHIIDEGLTLSGYSESNDSADILFRHKFVQPRSFSTYRILPSSTALFESIIMPAENQIRKTEIPVPDEVYNLALRLNPFLGDEISRVYLDLKGIPASESSLVIYKLRNRVQCEQILAESMKSKMTTDYFEPDDQTKIPVYITKSKGLASILMPDFVSGFDDLYYAFYDTYMITGNSYETVAKVLYDNMLSKTLANDINFRDFEEMVPSRAGYYFYCVPSHIIDFLAGYLNENIIRSMENNRSSLDKIESAGLQFASISGMIYNNLSVRYREEVREESTTEWETLLDTVASIKPFFFTNHNTGAKEIFIQDRKNNVYLVNAAGRVLWKVPIAESITGTVYMIDYYRNGKYQLLFSGKNNLHVLDRNGNYVARYPVKLRSRATNSLALFDYDNNRNYRLVIAGEDKMLYAYDREGSVVKGWKPFRTSGFVNAEAAFFRVSGKDYIIVTDETSLYFLDRSGNIRLQLKEPVTRAAGSGMRLVPGSAPSIICTSPDGTVQNIFFDGNVKKFTFRPFSVDHSFDFFDIDGDGFGEYVFIDRGILYLYDHNRDEMFTKEFDSGQLGGPIYFNFSSTDKKIGVFDINNKQIYLIDKTGEVMRGFPLRGASMFSINRLSNNNEWHLIVGGTDKFLYNYKLETDK